MSLTLIVILENILYLHVQIYQNILDEEFDDIDLIFQMVVVFFSTNLIKSLTWNKDKVN